MKKFSVEADKLREGVRYFSLAAKKSNQKKPRLHISLPAKLCRRVADIPVGRVSISVTDGDCS